MSEADAAALISRLKDDGAFRDEVMAAPDGETRWQIISAAGFDCTAGEFAAARERLSDEQLGEVSAGLSWPAAIEYEGCDRDFPVV
jgi:predicted ribosomally synthesized peptide with nif11-like leader